MVCHVAQPYLRVTTGLTLVWYRLTCVHLTDRLQVRGSHRRWVRVWLRKINEVVCF